MVDSVTSLSCFVAPSGPPFLFFLGSAALPRFAYCKASFFLGGGAL